MTTTPATATTLGWHFTNGHTLRDGRPVPPVGEWLVHEGPVKMCKSGLHFSELVTGAIRYAPGATLHQVEVRGVAENNPDDKGVARERRIIKTYPAGEVLPMLVRFAWACAWRAQEHAAAAADAAARAAVRAADAAVWAARAAASAAVWAARDAVRAAARAAASAAVRAADAASDAASAAARDAVRAADAASDAARDAVRAADAARDAERAFHEQLFLAGIAQTKEETPHSD